MSGFPIGCIIWIPSLDLMPTDCQLCDGTNGTPDLIGRCVVGAGDEYTVGASGVGGIGTDRTHDHGSGTVGLANNTMQHDWTSTIATVGAMSTAQLTVVTGNFPEYSGFSHTHDWSSTDGIPPIAGGDHDHPMSGTYAANERRIPLPRVCALYPIMKIA